MIHPLCTKEQKIEKVKKFIPNLRQRVNMLHTREFKIRIKP